jgi:hypothetical protein
MHLDLVVLHMRLVLVVVRKVIVVVIVLVKELMIKNYIGLLEVALIEVVFIHRFGKEEVVLELRSLNRMIP